MEFFVVETFKTGVRPVGDIGVWTKRGANILFVKKILSYSFNIFSPKLIPLKNLIGYGPKTRGKPFIMNTRYMIYKLGGT